MRWWIDTEFLERGHHGPLVLLSVGLVCEDGREYYAENINYDPTTANPWVKANVLPHLRGGNLRKTCTKIGSELRDFVGVPRTEAAIPEFWAYFGAHDWVLFAGLQGDFSRHPYGWPMYCNEIKQWANVLGVTREDIEKIPHVGTHHNALDDARWAKAVWEDLAKLAHSKNLKTED